MTAIGLSPCQFSTHLDTTGVVDQSFENAIGQRGIADLSRARKLRKLPSARAIASSRNSD